MKKKYLDNALPLVQSCLLVGLLAMVGCGSDDGATAIVQGAVTLDGELAKSGSVLFHSKGEHPAAYGTVGNDGTFTLRIGRGNVNNLNQSKIYPGDYTATVTINGPTVENADFEGAPPLPGPRLSAAKYGNKATSGLEYSVKAGRNVINIAVESPTEEELAELQEAGNTEASSTVETKSEDEEKTTDVTDSPSPDSTQTDSAKPAKEESAEGSDS